MHTEAGTTDSGDFEKSNSVAARRIVHATTMSLIGIRRILGNMLLRAQGKEGLLPSIKPELRARGFLFLYETVVGVCVTTVCVQPGVT